MPHEPKLTIYTIQIKPVNDQVEDSNRWLFRNIIGEANANDLEDSYIIGELFRKFISSLDTPRMYADPKSKKCMTANQANIQDEDVEPNIRLHTDKQIIEGKIEGGSYGRKRNKTSTIDKSVKSDVGEDDAITDNFYFLMYLPLQAKRTTLLVQSYSDDSIDSVIKKFWEHFFSFEGKFYKPEIKRFVPQAIIDDFKSSATVSSVTFSTDLPGSTLMEHTHTQTDRHYKVTVQITPLGDDLTMEEFENTIQPIEQAFFTRKRKLGDFFRKKGTLKDNQTKRTTPFDLGSSFEIQPSILLSKYIEIRHDESDFERIRQYCFGLLDDVKSEIYLQYAVQEHQPTY